MSLFIRRFCILASLALLAAVMPGARPALAANLVVTSFADDGSAGTLRAAIQTANSNGVPDTITFSAAGTINLTSPLPALSENGTTIDGTVPSGGTVPKVEIRGNGLAGQGILITSSNNTIRGLIINGFTNLSNLDYRGGGVVITGAGGGTAPTNNIVERNYLGTNIAGTAPGATPLNNVNGGVIIEFGASNNIVANNVISGNRGSGVFLVGDFSSTATQDNNIIRNNIIGLNASSTAAVGNGIHGVHVSDNSINTTVGPGNIISGNGVSPSDAAFGVYVIGRKVGGFISGTRVIGNKIGTNAAGDIAIPNTGQLGVGSGGVGVGYSSGTVIGGPNPADSNLISGNKEYGVSVRDLSVSATPGTSNISIQNNKIGVAQDGVTPLPNSVGGVYLWGKASGVTVGPNNVISGNTLDGVRIRGVPNQTDPNFQTRSITVTGNKIGVDATGNISVPNGNYGVRVIGRTVNDTISNNIIANNPSAGLTLNVDSNGYPTGITISGNTIRANGPVGIQFIGASSNNTVGPNNVVTNHTSAGLLIQSNNNTVKGNTFGPNNQNGILLANGASNNTIGGATELDGNVLTGNTLNGILVSGASTINNNITHTRTNTNGGKGIALESGGNLGGQFGRPGLSGLAISGTTLSGNVTNGANCGAGGCTIEVFTGNAPLVDEGPNFVTSFTSSGAFSNVSIAGCEPYLIFTVTDSAGNTSEFTNPIGPFAQCVPAAPQVAISPATPGPSSRGVLPGATTIYTHTVSNTGSGPGALTLSITQNPVGNAWAVLNRGNCPANGAILAANTSCTISVRVTVPANATPGAQNATTITAALGASTATATDTTTALLNPALTLTPPTQTKSTGAGQPVSFSHTLTNQGNGPDSFAITVAPPQGWTYTIAPTSPIALGQGASTTVTVTLTPPSGAITGTYTTTVTAASTNAPSTSASVSDVTTVTGAAVPQIASVVVPATIGGGGTTTITYTITNAGNQAGTFNLAFTQPASWTVTDAVSPSVTLAAGASATTSATLQAPASAPAGSYTARLVATATDANGATATKLDTITIGKLGQLALTPASQTTPVRAPNATYTDTLTLTNNGNFTDTVTLAATSSRGWQVGTTPSSVVLGPAATTQVEVRLTIPPGAIAGPPPNVTTVTATSSLQGVSATAQITTNVAAVPGVTLTPPTVTRGVDAGASITVTFTLQNSGSISQSYTLAAGNVPTGWSRAVTPTTTALLAPGAIVPVTLVVSAPSNGTEGSSINVDVTASCNQDTCNDKATATIIIGPEFGGNLSGSCTDSVLPGAIVVCQHTLTNTGSVSTTFSLEAISPLGWAADIAPPNLVLQPGASATFSVTLQVPTSADAGVIHTLTVRATPSGDPAATAEAQDTVTVLKVAGVDLSPDRNSVPYIGAEIVFQHVLVNTGNAPDRFDISFTQSTTWDVTVVPTRTVTLARGAQYPIEVRVKVPTGIPGTPQNTVTVRATSRNDPAVSDEVIDTVSWLTDAGTFPDTIWYFPMVYKR